MIVEPDFAHQGEDLSIAEILVVTPVWGRLRGRHPLVKGQPVERGDVIGWMHEGGDKTPLTCNARATFIQWLAQDGERLSPGRRVAALRLADV